MWGEASDLGVSGFDQAEVAAVGGLVAFVVGSTCFVQPVGVDASDLAADGGVVKG